MGVHLEKTVTELMSEMSSSDVQVSDCAAFPFVPVTIDNKTVYSVFQEYIDISIFCAEE